MHDHIKVEAQSDSVWVWLKGKYLALTTSEARELADGLHKAASEVPAPTPPPAPEPEPAPVEEPTDAPTA